MVAWRLMACLAGLLAVGAARGWAESAGAMPHARVCAVHPWIDADAEQLPVLLREPATEIRMAGPRNDWLTGAVAIAADQETTVRVAVAEPAALKGRVQMRVVGQVRERRQRRVVWDPLISREDLPDKARQALNFEQIKGFPTLTVTPKVPAFLWFTVNLSGVPAGQYDGAFTATEAGSATTTTIPIHIEVLPAELPVQSPLCGIAWNWTNSPQMIRDFIDHGVNVAFRNHEDAWNAGAKFLLFQLSSSFSRKPIDDAKKQEVASELDKIRALVKRLGVPKGQWAVYPCDEPKDETAPIDLAYGRLIKRLRPDVPLWYNPAWIAQADGLGNTTTTKGTLRVLAPVADYWCPYVCHLWDGGDTFAYMKSTRKPVWAYEILEASFARRPSAGREILRKAPWMAWKYGLRGFGIFSANDVPNDPWADLDPASTGYPNYSFTYPGANGVMSSRGFEALRQGVQEYKRLHALKQLGADRKVLDAWDNLGISAQSAETFDVIRSAMDDLLVQLTAQRKGSTQAKR